MSADLTALADRMTEVAVRHLNELDRFPKTRDALEAASFRMLAEPEIAAGLRDSRLLAELGPRLAALDAVHQPRRWRDSDVVVCDHCQKSFPCETARILNGELVSA